MHSILPERFTSIGLALCLGLFLSGLISAADKPILSEAIDEAIAEHGAAAAIQLFADNYERDKDRYTVDMKGISDLGGKYAMEHKLEEAGAVMQIASPYIYRTTSSSNNLAASTMKDMEEAQKKSAREEEKYRQQEKQRRAEFQQQHAVALNQPPPTSTVSGEMPLVATDAGYSAISYLDATNPGGRKYRSVLNIQQANQKMRFENMENRDEPIVIFRYDKGVMWLVHREKKGYEGVKLYQEFELTQGKGINSHIDHLMFARQGLLAPQELKDMGTEAIDGQDTTHYYKKVPNPAYEDGYDSYHYWVNADGIMVRMAFTSVEVAFTLDTRDIQIANQADEQFMPPPGYKRAGTRISWKEEKRKLDANPEKMPSENGNSGS